MMAIDVRFQQFEEDLRKKLRDKGCISKLKDYEALEPSIEASQKHELIGSTNHESPMKNFGGEESS